MEKEFWLERWEKQQIGFHKDDYNLNLIQFFENLNLDKGSHVLVPLCGKTLDLIWLAEHGYKVTGVELSEIAIKDFFQENKIDYKTENIGNFIKYSAENITLFQGDMFEVDEQLIGKFDAIYDRASTVALPETMRIQYLEKIKELSHNHNTLMILFEYDQSKVEGPPFSVSEEFINKQFEGFNLKKLKEIKLEQLAPKFAEAQTAVYEKVFLIRG